MTTSLYLHIVESIPLGVVVVDRHGHIQTMNRQAMAILDVGDSSIKKETIQTLVGPLPIEGLFSDETAPELSGTKIRRNAKVFEITGSRMQGGGKGAPKAVITLRDITQAEKMEDLERKKEKALLISELSAEIAHEIRNPLGSIELLASLLKKESRREKEFKRANQIMAAVKTVEQAVSNLIHRSQKEQLPVAPVHIHDLLKEILMFSERILDGGAVFLSVRYADMEPVVECNADMLKQIFLHLILNGLAGAGSLDIVTNGVREGRAIEIHFIEKGGGDTNPIRAVGFNPLSPAREDRWGLGLAIVHNIVSGFHGSIRVEYRDKIGTALVLSFPLLQAQKSRPTAVEEPNGFRKDDHAEK